MGHGAHGIETAPALQVVSTENEKEENGSVSSNLVLLTPFQLGPFKLSHRIALVLLTRSRSYGFVPSHSRGSLHRRRHWHFGNLRRVSRDPCDLDTGASGILEIYRQGCARQGRHFLLPDLSRRPRRASHTSYQPGGAPPPSSTNRPLKNGQVKNSGELVDASTPQAIETEEVAEFVEQFRNSARNAIEAGFDGVEVHATHGKLIDQFLKGHINERTGKYGRSVENRSRFMVEVVEAITKEIGSDRVGIRASPFTNFQEATDPNPTDLALHVVEPMFQFAGEIQTEDRLRPMNIQEQILRCRRV